MDYNLRRAIVIGLVVLSLLQFGMHFFGYDYFARTASKTSNQDTGLVYVINRHGDLFYTDKHTYFVWQGLLFSSVLTFLLAAYLGQKWKITDANGTRSYTTTKNA